MKFEIDINVELPQLNKFLFCLPLRAGLKTWAFVQLILASLYIVYLCSWVSEPHYKYDTYIGRIILVFIFCLVWTTLDVICCCFVIRGVNKSNGNFLEAAYNYLRIKVPAYAVLIVIILLILVVSTRGDLNFFFYFDSWTYFALFLYPAVGVLLWVSQLYFLLLVNSMIVNLGHHMDLATLYSRLRKNTDATHELLTENILQESKVEDVEKKIDGVC